MSSILYLCSDWTNNTGNRFIDMGAKRALELATGEEVPYLSASCQDLFVRDSKLRQIANKLPREYLNPLKNILEAISEDLIKVGQPNEEEIQSSLDNSLQIATLVEDSFDYIAFSGMRLTSQSLNRLNHVFDYLSDKYGTEIIIIGAGGATYSKSEVQQVRNWLEKYDPYILSTRDPDAYNHYGDIPRHSYNGVDSAFFINDAFDPMPFTSDYTVINLDRHQESEISAGGSKTIRTGHKCRNIPDHYLDHENTLVSSFPEEYLHIYANANTVYTDRLHACIPSIMFETPCQYILDAPKNSLFDNANIGLSKNKVKKYPIEVIEEEKSKQIEFIKNALK